MKKLNDIESLDQLPKKMKDLLLNLIQVFDIKNCVYDESEDDYSIEEGKLSEAFCALCKNIVGDNRLVYFSLLNSLEYDLYEQAGYNVKVALKYYRLLSKFAYDIDENKKIDYQKFCNTLYRFDRYFSGFKWQCSIPQELSICLQILDHMFWNSDYSYPELKLKINRKIRLVLSEYNHALLSIISDNDFGDEEYADEFEDQLICDDWNCELFDDKGSDDYIYLSCCFNENLEGTTYYYRTKDYDIELGDEIIVPFGIRNIERHAWVVDKEYYFADNVPLAIEKTKEILKKVDNEE